MSKSLFTGRTASRTKSQTAQWYSSASAPKHAVSRQQCERQKCERHQCEARSANANSAKETTVSSAKEKKVRRSSVRRSGVRMPLKCDRTKLRNDSAVLGWSDSFFAICHAHVLHKLVTINLSSKPWYNKHLKSLAAKMGHLERSPLSPFP